jgi:hypothetical protein
MAALAPALQAYFTERSINQRAASPNTIAAYRTTFRLLLAFTAQRTGTAPSELDIDDLNATAISASLDHLEHVRGNSPATRNNGWQRSTRCSATSPYTPPSTPPASNGCWRSRPSAPSATS